MCNCSEKHDKVYMATDRRLWFTHKCRFCNYLFVCEKDLVHHEATHDVPDFACDNCSSVFDDAEQLSMHVNHGCSVADSSTDISRQHVCGTCGEIFRFVRELYKHYGDQHMDQPALMGRKSDIVNGASVCANCGAIFSGTASLKVHLWKAHNLNDVQQRDLILENDGHSPVAYREQLDSASASCQRLLTTDNDKPFKCSMCNWSFKYDFSFRAHLRMHEEKQRLLEEMVRANCENQSAVDDVTAVDVAPDISVSSSGGEVRVPIVLVPVKRKLQNSDGAYFLPQPKASIICRAKCSTSSCYLTTDSDADADCLKQVGSDVTADQHSVNQTCLKPVTVSGMSSEMLQQSPNLSSSVVTDTSSFVKTRSPSVDYSPCSEEPFRFACKLCSFKCRYDFSYIAHLNQHDKLKELQIDDLQSHLVASSAQIPTNSHILNKFAIQVIGTNDGDVPHAQGHTQVVDSSGISYILLCPGAMDQASLLTSLPHQQKSVITQPSVAADAVDCLNSSGVVFVDDINSTVEQDLDSATIANSSGVDVDFSVGQEMQFLNSTSGETMYVINETSLPVAVPIDSTTEHQRAVVYEEAETELVLSPEPSDGQLLDVVDVANLRSDEDGCSDESVDGEDSFTCYYCNAVFLNKSPLQQHILQLHVD